MALKRNKKRWEFLCFVALVGNVTVEEARQRLSVAFCDGTLVPSSDTTQN